MSDYCEKCNRPKLNPDKPCVYCEPKQEEKVKASYAIGKTLKTIFITPAALISIVFTIIVLISPLLGAVIIQQVNEQVPGMVGLESPEIWVYYIVIFFSIGFFLFFREICCWYFKFNKIVKTQEEILQELKKLNAK